MSLVLRINHNRVIEKLKSFNVIANAWRKPETHRFRFFTNDIFYNYIAMFLSRINKVIKKLFLKISSSSNNMLFDMER